MGAEAAPPAGVLAVDFGGTDCKLVRWSAAGEAWACDPPWVEPPSTWTDPGRWQTELRRLISEALAASPGPVRALGLSFPDRIDGDRIVGDPTTKTAGLRRARPHDWKPAFDAEVGGLLGELCAWLGCPGVIVNDGVAAAAAAAASVEGPCLVLSLGTSLAAGWIGPDSAVYDDPPAASRLRIRPDAEGPPGAPAGEAGLARYGATQLGLLARLPASGEAPRDRVRAILEEADEPVHAALIEAMGADLALTVRHILPALPAPTRRVAVLGRLVRESRAILTFARRHAPEFDWLGPEVVRVPGGLDPAHYGQAWGVARLAAARA